MIIYKQLSDKELIIHFLIYFCLNDHTGFAYDCLKNLLRRKTSFNV